MLAWSNPCPVCKCSVFVRENCVIYMDLTYIYIDTILFYFIISIRKKFPSTLNIICFLDLT